MKHISFLLLLFLFPSCFKQTITVKNDLSGIYNSSMQIDQSAVDFFQSLKNTNTSVDTDLFFLYSEDTLKNKLKKIKKIRVRNITVNENKNTKTYTIDLLFSDFTEMPDILLNKYIKTTIIKDKNNIIIKTAINTGILGNDFNIIKIYEQLNSDMKAIIDAFSSIISFNLVYNGPSEIIKSTSLKKGIITNNNMTIEYTYSLYDILQSKNGIEIVTLYKK
ncbi:MAG: hypothetical protein A2355_06430 [Spirochaetes bacterium RIFOXYB1_FULL_32_8]|nr:MAG: hypothetical protein A2Y30_09885 [Spirochaetes bacterium GWE1_32_154]OHD46482.1 MAG: hypothetical protein A2Y29_04015 [Spirochaetes bacterium GWE2_31_10]OHD83177.1 MAG: hypothetical protein A2355_06430 [Spirochaetes bacterium RIFOXYB1_FULL_32_8]HBD93396.1 hypothetical protein [Spirochaetia bacterium]HBI37067.1 hypothetical protein [Spirochaetia bacterium]